MTSHSPLHPLKKNKNLDTDEGNYVIRSPLLTDESVNPCVKEQNLTTKCMYENNYLKHKCVDAFDNYTLCQRFWKMVSWKRWLDGTTPHLPPPEERDQVKREMLQKIMNKSEE